MSQLFKLWNEGERRTAFSAWHRHCSLSLVANEDDTEAIEVDSPVHQVYSHWTRFEDFPHFMQGVKKVILLDDQRLHWETEFTGTTKEWFATITDLTPDQQIAWESEDGEYVAGIVTFEPIGTSRTRLNLKLFYDSKGCRRAEERFLSSAGDRVEKDLENLESSSRSRIL